MGDYDLYGWDKVGAYHRVWLNQLEQDTRKWDNAEEKFRQVRVWHTPASTSSAAKPPQQVATRDSPTCGELTMYQPGQI